MSRPSCSQQVMPGAEWRKEIFPGRPQFSPLHVPTKELGAFVTPQVARDLVGKVVESSSSEAGLIMARGSAPQAGDGKEAEARAAARVKARAKPCTQVQEEATVPSSLEWAREPALGPTVAQGQVVALLDQSDLLATPLLQLIQAKEACWGDTPLHHRLRLSLSWWRKNATPQVVSLITEGIKPQWDTPPRLSIQGRQGSNLEQAQNILEDYEKSGAVRRVSTLDTQHLLPWFLISKPEEGGAKWRFISDCREINQHFHVQKFRLDHMQEIFPALQKGHWAAKIDLKDAYFHLPVHPSLKPFLRHLVGTQVWEYQAGPFGLNVMPQLFQNVMHTFQKKWRKRGAQIYIYLDDILLVAPTQSVLQKYLRMLVEDLTTSGFKINVKKSVLRPSQQVTHLGFMVDLADGKLKLAPPKVKSI